MAIQPWFFSEGTTPSRLDTKGRVWKKILGAYQNKAGALAGNDPARNDTVQQTRQKVNKALKGVT